MIETINVDVSSFTDIMERSMRVHSSYTCAVCKWRITQFAEKYVQSGRYYYHVNCWNMERASSTLPVEPGRSLRYDSGRYSSLMQRHKK